MPTPPADASAGAGAGRFGPNAWLVDDLYERYLADPESVAPSWREFFSDYQRAPRAHPAAAPAPSTPAPASEAPVALRGAALAIATNMTASLEVPTATSVRTVPARLLEINRALMNEHLSRSSGAKVSFTHVIAFAVLRGLEQVPALNATFVAATDDKGTPGVVHHEHVGLGLAVDVERADGSRTLMVPVVRDADTLDFGEFLLAYEDLVRRVHAGWATLADLRGRPSRSRTRDARDRPVRPAPDARAGRHRRGRGARVAERVRGRRPDGARAPRRRQGPHPRRRPTTTGSSRAPSRASSSATSRSA